MSGGRVMRCCRVVVLCCVVFGCALGGVARAEGLKPWWGLSAGERPTDLKTGVAKDAVAQLVVSATAGEFALIEGLAAENGELFDEEAGHEGEPDPATVALVSFDAKASVVQADLETLYGPERRVEVTGGPGDAGGSSPYVITFPGQAFCSVSVSTRCVHVPVVSGELPGLFFGRPSLSGGKAEANLTEVSGGALRGDGQIIVDAQNRGDGPTSGTVTVTDTLPAGLKAVQIEASAGGIPPHGNSRPVSCSLKTLTCSYEPYVLEKVSHLPVLAPYEQIEVRITVELQPGAASGEQNTATVSGGGAPRAVNAAHAIEVNGTEKFGVEDWELIPENVGGSPDTQAGSHPFQLTNITTFNSGPPDKEGQPTTVGTPKDVIGELPAGFLGNPTPFAQCTDQQFSKQPESPGGTNECPAASAIGVATVTFNEPNNEHFETATAPIFNMKPLPGEPARFAFKALGLIPAFLDASVRTGSDYGVTITSSNIIQIASLLSVKLTFWGVPGDARHDPQRGWECIKGFGSCPISTATSPPPFLAMATSCEAPFQSTVHADSWGSFEDPSQQADPVTYRLPEGLVGCNRLPFGASIGVTPDVPDASTPTGLSVDVHVPQTASLNPEGLAESTLKNTTVVLPEGVALNPSGADGLEACPEGQVGYSGSEGEHDLFTPGLPSCPNASKVATVKIKTPLLPNPLEGEVYLATQDTNPFGSLVAMYLIAEDPVSGTLIKLAGEVKPDAATGQLVTTFNDTPELPFEDLELHFFGGERAPLGTPSHCRSYKTSATFTPWSGGQAATPSSSFQITSGPHGTPCPGTSLPFTPTLTAGATNIQAGSFTPFNTTMSREDGQQNLQAIRLQMPAGLSGLLSSVKLCGEAEADAGTCGPESLIGETIVSVGLGNEPYSVTGGKVYITGPYQGAPFGLSIVNPAVAGPYNLGQVIVRAKIEVDPHTTALTITTDPTGPYAIPHILDGIPLQIKHVAVTINRPGFTFNPTSCNPKAITATLNSSENTTFPLTVPFQVTNCATLKFTPKFTVSTSGKTSKAHGASLTAKLSYPTTPQGTQANIAAVKVDLPEQLPSRLSTLQKACLAAVFEANPANCPTESIVGHAIVHTQLLPVPLIGPAYFVSHGGEAFPSLTIVLQGYGVTVDLVGTTLIRKGITSTTFQSTPDVPFESFEITLPEGKNSALAANGALCKAKLNMPTAFRAQNGVEIHQTTKMSVTKCPKTKAKKNTKSKKKPKKK